ncbi:UNC-like C-terminal-domain-containing protein [Phaeosphaeria sp. MPI-PUGE-AT-0046c]|nr:UNC-like C-terminal-domain-containing protein [Phaeosphaeria sp. MPI-PUGE-AT-0046c]
MPAIGVSFRTWTLCLLLCSVSTPACTQPTNDTAVVDSGATAYPSTTTTHAAAAPPASTLSARSYADADPTCPFRTINYITHTLPQQCAKTAWTAPSEAAPSEAAGAVEGSKTRVPEAHSAAQGNSTGRDTQDERHHAPEPAPQADNANPSNSIPRSGTTNEESESELETDSPLDNANFLSFEEWKKRNLAQVGQSPENVGQGRAAPSNQAARRRPVNVNALDSLGDEAEIELDFSGFGPPPSDERIASNDVKDVSSTENGQTVDVEKKATPSAWALSKDAGKTCKERFNYASFDCAATVLKTNKQAKSATSVLVENKDSYMLNECSADNKFIIVELCDDILVDTVVLANYEFFSSMFRHFRVSVSDRYPVKMERWKMLGTFEARNSRDMQPFLITEPQIWARYLRIEFLTQFGNEFYCPLSLLRVHGTTMMEQFRREEEEARGVEDDVDVEAEQDVVTPAVDSGPLPPEKVPIVQTKDDSASLPSPAIDSATESTNPSTEVHTSSSVVETSVVAQQSTTQATPSNIVATGLDSAHNSSTLPAPTDTQSSLNVSLDATLHEDSASQIASAVDNTHTLSHTPTSSTGVETQLSPAAPHKHASKLDSSANDTRSSQASSAPASKAATNNTANSPQPPPRPSSTQPNPATPSTQESFFKSIHKRLLYLEANSTLSLQYIEEQSRILRDAFVKVEKRQLIKTEKFLDHLNSTVMNELKSFRTQYDQLWQSTVIELESMKERQRGEMSEIGTRLSLMADELVWQKRMAVVQSTLLLLCLGLVLFVRSGTLGSAADVPIVQQLGSKYSSFFESSPPRSPPESGTARRRRTLKNMWRSDTSVGMSDHHSDGQNVLSDAEVSDAKSPVEVEYSPPTPDSPGTLAESDVRNGLSPARTMSSMQDTSTPEETPSPDDQIKRLEVLETQSGPATPSGSRDSRPSWEEVDRAMDQLKAEGTGQTSSRAKRRERDKKKKRSPLRRAHSSFEGTADGSAPDDSGTDMFIG